MLRRSRHEKKLPLLCLPSIDAQTGFQHYVKRQGPQPILLRFINTLILSIVCLTTPAWADFKAGEKAYQQGDYATALREWQPLAKQGQAAAQYHLGLLYANGQGLPKDDAQARQWYEKAAVQEHAEAQANLGSLYDYARGGPQDFKMAVRWYRRSAEQGNDLAQRRLGLLYERGDGVQKDYVQAYMWYKLGAANGGKSGAIMRDELAARMTSDQLAEAKKLAREWKPKHK